MKLELPLGGPFFSRAVGPLGTVVLWPVRACVGLAIRLACEPSQTVLRRLAVYGHPLDTVFLFNTRRRIDGFLKRSCRHALPLLLNVVEGRTAAIEPIRTDWSKR